jgi:hypothetical protein
MDEVEIEREERGEKEVRMEERRGVKERKRFVRVEECIFVVGWVGCREWLVVRFVFRS